MDNPSKNGSDPDALAAVEALVEAQEKLPQDTCTISNGVTFNIKKVAMETVRRATEDFEPPKIPKTENKAKGRKEENPNDPAYLEALQEYHVKSGMATFKLFLVLGTEVKEIPEGVYGPEDTYWSEALEIAGISVPDSGAGRYYNWLTQYCLTEEEDQQALYLAVLSKSGLLREGAVQAAIASFRGDSSGGSDTDDSPQESSRHGSKVQQPAPRSRTGTRRKRRG